MKVLNGYKEKREPEERFYSQMQTPSHMLRAPVCPSCSCVSLHAVHFSEIHFLAVAIGSACVLMILVVTVAIICRHHRKKAQEKKIEVADTEP